MKSLKEFISEKQKSLTAFTKKEIKVLQDYGDTMFEEHGLDTDDIYVLTAEPLDLGGDFDEVTVTKNVYKKDKSKFIYDVLVETTDSERNSSHTSEHHVSKPFTVEDPRQLKTILKKLKVY